MARTSRRLAPPNAILPVSISYNTQPALYTSLRASLPPSPCACSGLMYAAVPIGSPRAVSELPLASPIARAMPKSETIAWPLERRMFSGLMSR